MSKQPEMVIARNPRATRNNDTTLNLATKINRSVNLDKVVFNASQMKDPQHKWRQALPVAVGAV